MTEVANKVADRVSEAHADLHFSKSVKIDSITRELKLTMRSLTRRSRHGSAT